MSQHHRGFSYAGKYSGAENRILFSLKHVVERSEGCFEILGVERKFLKKPSEVSFTSLSGEQRGVRKAS